MSPWPLSDASDIDIRPAPVLSSAERACENRNTGGSRFQFDQIAVCAIGIETPEMLRTLMNLGRLRVILEFRSQTMSPLRKVVLAKK